LITRATSAEETWRKLAPGEAVEFEKTDQAYKRVLLVLYCG
jgi:hypothetical protein